MYKWLLQDCSLFKKEIKKKKWRKRLQALTNSIATKDWTTGQKTGKISIKTGQFLINEYVSGIYYVLDTMAGCLSYLLGVYSWQN